ncbi:MAG: deoxyribonuclease V [Chloroflexi bacterium]|nr:deoxyribonuclease V [Chloroflexota bacterium]
MQVLELHSWKVTSTEAKAIQTRLAGMVSQDRSVTPPKLVAGVDVSKESLDGVATGAVVVMSYPQLNLVETRVVRQKVTFPYVPGILSFREAPVILAACQQLTTVPDVILVDGQGIAHPRRLGIASHLGLLLNTPSIGCAKSILCGKHGLLEKDTGSFAEMKDGAEVVGVALRTKAGVRPVYISVGHKVDLPTAISVVMNCCRGYRLPEPMRLAHLAASGVLSSRGRPRATAVLSAC